MESRSYKTVSVYHFILKKFNIKLVTELKVEALIIEYRILLATS